MLFKFPRPTFVGITLEFLGDNDDLLSNKDCRWMLTIEDNDQNRQCGLMVEGLSNGIRSPLFRCGSILNHYSLKELKVINSLQLQLQPGPSKIAEYQKEREDLTRQYINKGISEQYYDRRVNKIMDSMNYVMLCQDSAIILQSVKLEFSATCNMTEKLSV